MRTTLDIADDVLLAVKELARREKRTTGEVLSQLARKGLQGGSSEFPKAGKELFGFRPFPSRGGVVTNELIAQLREDDG